MNKQEALEFLAAHQPLPSDRELTEDVIKKYDEVRQFLLKQPEPECARLFLNSFGEGNGLGVYQLVGTVLRKLPESIVVAELKNSLRSQHRSVRYWSAQIAAAFPSVDLIPALKALLSEDDFDMKYSALTALEQIGNNARSVVAEFMKIEHDPELKSLAEEILNAE